MSNFLRQNYFSKQLRSRIVSREKFQKRLLHKKADCKKVVKLKPLGNLTKLLQAAFTQISYCQKITKPICN